MSSEIICIVQYLSLSMPLKSFETMRLVQFWVMHREKTRNHTNSTVLARSRIISLRSKMYYFMDGLFIGPKFFDQTSGPRTGPTFRDWRIKTILTKDPVVESSPRIGPKQDQDRTRTKMEFEHRTRFNSDEISRTTSERPTKRLMVNGLVRGLRGFLDNDDVIID